ncbi:MAG: hypothetical protein AAGK05_16545, partial [Pseudomonadota bacterium]
MWSQNILRSIAHNDTSNSYVAKTQHSAILHSVAKSQHTCFDSQVVFKKIECIDWDLRVVYRFVPL